MHLSTKKRRTLQPWVSGSLIQTPKSKTTSESEIADFISNISSFRQDCAHFPQKIIWFWSHFHFRKLRNLLGLKCSLTLRNTVYLREKLMFKTHLTFENGETLFSYCLVYFRDPDKTEAREAEQTVTCLVTAVSLYFTSSTSSSAVPSSPSLSFLACTYCFFIRNFLI